MAGHSTKESTVPEDIVIQLLPGVNLLGFFMGKFSRYKVNCSELPELMAREQGTSLPTESDTDEFFRILQKDEVDVSDTMVGKIQRYVSRVAEHDKFGLSGSIKKVLYKHYAYSQFGASKISNGGEGLIQLEKGEAAEPDAIKLLSKRDGVEYVKNERLYQNRWFRGVPDILIKDGKKVVGVKDIKVPLDLPSFLERFDGDALRDDRWEMLAYLDILGLKEGEICYCLVNMPDRIIESRLAYYKERLLSQGVSDSHISKNLKQIEESMRYDYIPEELRIKRFTVTRQKYFTKQFHDRVKLVRQRLNRLHEKFQNSNLILVESTEPSLESIS